MPLIITAPQHSFVQFSGSLDDTVLPAYRGIDIAFQFTFSPEMKIALQTPVYAGVAYVNGSPLNLSFLAETVCAEGQFEEIDFASDFPVTISSFPLAGTYNTPEELLKKVSDTYGITATGQVFSQCCNLDSLPKITFIFNNGRSAGVNFYKGVQWVKLTGDWSLIPVQPGQCFRYAVKVGGDVAVSNIFERVASDEFITDVEYSNNENAYGFTYQPIVIQKQEEATPPTGNQALVTGVRASSWNSNGARIYAPGFPLNGLGSVVAHLTTPHFWVNGEEAVEIVNGSPTGNENDGRMNANGVWVNNNTAPGSVWLPTDEWIGFSRKIILTGPKLLYVAISGDNWVRLKINGLEILNTTGSDVFNPASGINFLTLSIYPVYFPLTTNYLEMSIMNTSVNFSSNPAGFACEIYDMSAAEIQAATSEADLRIVFRTRDMIGQPFDIGTTIGYSCRDGWVLTKDNDGKYICVQIQEGDYTYNRLWLPILLKKPAYPENRKVYKKSSGLFKVLSAVIEKEWECKTEVLTDAMHEKIAVMLAHDNIHFINRKIDSDIFKKDDYQIGWGDTDTEEAASATFKINIPFAGRNSNCEKRRVCLPALNPSECIPILLDTAFTFPAASVGLFYSVTQQIFAGSGPITVTAINKPAWMNIAAQGTTGITYSGTPDAAGSGSVQLSLANCDTSPVLFSSPITTGTSGGQSRGLSGSVSASARNIRVTLTSAPSDDITVTVDANVQFDGATQRTSFDVLIPAGATSGLSSNTPASDAILTCIFANNNGKYVADVTGGANNYTLTLTINSTIC